MITSRREDRRADAVEREAKAELQRRLTWLGIVIVLLFGGYSAAWFYVAAKLEAVAGAAIAGLNRAAPGPPTAPTRWRAAFRSASASIATG